MGFRRKTSRLHKINTNNSSFSCDNKHKIDTNLLFQEANFSKCNLQTKYQQLSAKNRFVHLSTTANC